MSVPPPAPYHPPPTWPQLWLGMSFLTLAGLAVVLVVRDPNHFAPFVHSETGYQMLVGSVVLLAVYAVGYALGTAALTRVYRHDPGGPGRQVAQAVWTVLAFTFMCLPVAFVMLVGPAAVKVEQNLRNG